MSATHKKVVKTHIGPSPIPGLSWIKEEFDKIHRDDALILSKIAEVHKQTTLILVKITELVDAASKNVIPELEVALLKMAELSRSIDEKVPDLPSPVPPIP